MREPVNEHEFATITAELDRRTEALAPALETRLDRARRHAVEEGLAPWRLTLPFMGRLTLAGAGAALAVLLTVSLQKEPVLVPPTAQAVEEFEILTAHEQMDVVEDPEFFRWLLEHEPDALCGEV